MDILYRGPFKHGQILGNSCTGHLARFWDCYFCNIISQRVEYTFHVGFKWVPANVILTSGMIWGEYNVSFFAGLEWRALQKHLHTNLEPLFSSYFLLGLVLRVHIQTLEMSTERTGCQCGVFWPLQWNEIKLVLKFRKPKGVEESKE